MKTIINRAMLDEKSSIASNPKGIEYEYLMNRLNPNVPEKGTQKSNIVDKRKKDEFVVAPGFSPENQSLVNFDEPLQPPPYPITDIPYSQGVVW